MKSIKGGNQMKLYNLIKEIYGSVDKMLEETQTDISRSYIYQLIKGEKANLSFEVAGKLVTILKLNSMDELKEILKDDEKPEEI